MNQFLRAAGCVLATLGLVAATAACGDDSDKPSATSTPVQSVTSTTTTQPQPSPTRTVPAPSATPTESAPAVKRCATADLALTTLPAGAAAGTHFLSLVLTNAGGAECTLTGFPGVSLIDAAGQQVGSPADRNGAIMPEVVTLQPGESAHAVAGFPNYQNFPAGKCSGPSASVKVYPPDDLTALVAPLADYSCPGFSVQVVQPGKNEPGRG